MMPKKKRVARKTLTPEQLIETMTEKELRDIQPFLVAVHKRLQDTGNVEQTAFYQKLCDRIAARRETFEKDVSL